MADEKIIQRKSEEIVTEMGLLLIEVKIRKRKDKKFIEIFIDGEKDITLDNCAAVSRSLSDELDLIIPPDSYQIDVSSPGVDRPLRFLEQYRKHTGRAFDVHFTDSDGVKKGISGKLEQVDGNVLWFEKGKEKFRVPFDSISKAKVKVSL